MLVKIITKVAPIPLLLALIIVSIFEISISLKKPGALIYLSIGNFFIIIEALYSYLKQDRVYRLTDSLASLINISLYRSFKLLAYTWIAITCLGYFSQFSLWVVPSNTWWAWILVIICCDGSEYYNHILHHKIPLLWTFHSVHHCSDKYNLTVGVRLSWLSGAYTWIFFIPMVLLGFDPLMIMAGNAIVQGYQFFVHTEYIHKLGIFEKFMNTPSHHRVHHGANPQYLDKNFAPFSILWDKAFGTFEAEVEKVRYGLSDPMNSDNPLYFTFREFYRLVKRIFNTSGISSKIALAWIPTRVKK